MRQAPVFEHACITLNLKAGGGHPQEAGIVSRSKVLSGGQTDD